MRRYFLLWLRFVWNSVTREMAFSANFILQVVGNLLQFALVLLFFGVIYRHTDAIHGWSAQQTYFLVATNQVVAYIYQMLFARNLGRFPQLIRSGGLDHLLLKPADTQFISSTRYFDLRPLLLLPAPLLLLVHAAVRLDLTFSSGEVVAYVLLVACGVSLRYVLGFAVMMLSFFLVEVSALHSLQNQFLSYAGYPASIYRGHAEAVFTFIVPVVLIANLPAAAVLGTLSDVGRTAAYAAGYLVVLGVCSRLLFYRCIRYYASASS